jgi:hypothetical protein
VSMLDELKGHNILKLILIVRFACATLDVGHPICLFHVSDNVTTISGDYDTKLGRDALYYEYSGFSLSSTTRSDY